MRGTSWVAGSIKANVPRITMSWAALRKDPAVGFRLMVVINLRFP